jgi:hypothetical protein
MTLSIALLNPRESIFVTDRRFVEEGGLVRTEEGSKLAVFICPDARVAVTYTGLAAVGKFTTHQWLLQSLVEAAKPDLQIRPTMDRLAIIASRDIAKLGLPKVSSRLSITFCGYNNEPPPPLACICRITNFENDDGTSVPEAREEFSVTCLRQRRDACANFAQAWAFGMARAIPRGDLLALENLMTECKPAHAVLEKAVEIIRSAAASRLSGGLIGQQCLSVIVPADPGRSVLSRYHPNEAKFETFMPSIINAMSLRTLGWVGDLQLKAVSVKPTTPPLAFPRVGRNQPCPCGRGKKYKHCCGRVDRLYYKEFG